MRAITTLPTLALLLGLTSAPADAVTSVALSGRDSMNYFYYFGGFAVSGDEGEDGAPAPLPGGAFEGVRVTDLAAAATLAIVGSDHYVIQYLSWSGFLDETWDQAQTFSVGAGGSGAELRASGHASVSQTSQVCSTTCGLASELHRSTNTQAIEFTLDASNAYTLAGHTAGGQYVDLLIWDQLSQRWFPLVFGAVDTINATFSLSGNLAAGRYQVRNDPYTFSAGGLADVDNSWDYTLTLSGAVVAVPEPAPWLSLGAGLIAMGSRRQRRR